MSPFPCKDKDKRNSLKRQYNISTSFVEIQNKIYGLTQLLLWMNLAFLKFLLLFLQESTFIFMKSVLS